MTDELISCLMKIEALRVASRTSVMARADAGKPLRQIARELDVDWVVEGAVLQSDRRVRVTAHLIDGASETQLWSVRWNRLSTACGRLSATRISCAASGWSLSPDGHVVAPAWPRGVYASPSP
jgi:TolB-like protein